MTRMSDQRQVYSRRGELSDPVRCGHVLPLARWGIGPDPIGSNACRRIHASVLAERRDARRLRRGRGKRLEPTVHGGPELRAARRCATTASAQALSTSGSAAHEDGLWRTGRPDDPRGIALDEPGRGSQSSAVPHSPDARAHAPGRVYISIWIGFKRTKLDCPIIGSDCSIGRSIAVVDQCH